MRSPWEKTMRLPDRFRIRLFVCLILLGPEQVWAIGQLGNNDTRSLNIEVAG